MELKMNLIALTLSSSIITGFAPDLDDLRIRIFLNLPDFARKVEGVEVTRYQFIDIWFNSANEIEKWYNEATCIFCSPNDYLHISKENLRDLDNFRRV